MFNYIAAIRIRSSFGIRLQYLQFLEGKFFTDTAIRNADSQQRALSQTIRIDSLALFS